MDKPSAPPIDAETTDRFVKKAEALLDALLVLIDAKVEYWRTKESLCRAKRDHLDLNGGGRGKK